MTNKTTIMRTSIILALALVIVGLTYAANQAGAFQNIGTEHSEGAEFGMHLPAPDNNAIGAQTSVRPERSGHRPGEGRGHADGEMGGLVALVPITMPSSTSQSVLTEPLGSITGSFAPCMQVVDFMNTMGSLGMGMPASAAWSE